MGQKTLAAIFRLRDEFHKSSSKPGSIQENFRKHSINVLKSSWKRPGNVLQSSWKRPAIVLETPWKLLFSQKVSYVKHMNGSSK